MKTDIFPSWYSHVWNIIEPSAPYSKLSQVDQMFDTIVHRAVARFDIMMSTTHLAMDWVEYLCKMSKYN